MDFGYLAIADSLVLDQLHLKKRIIPFYKVYAFWSVGSSIKVEEYRS